MTRPVDTERVAHFRRHHLLWLALAHFLSADLLRELVMAVTEAVGRDAVAFDRLSTSRSTTDRPIWPPGS